ncbi:unnamed protein product [Camellia sinensis]
MNLYCEKHDLEVSEDTEKNFAELLFEELKLRETEALESQQRADMVLLEAKRLHPNIKRRQTSAIQGWKLVKRQGKKQKQFCWHKRD